MMYSYTEFLDDVIVAIADEQGPPGLGEVQIQDICDRHNIVAQETWVQLAAKDMADYGWGKSYSQWGGGGFQINGGGLRRADEIRKSKQEAAKSLPSETNWAKLSAIFAGIAIPVAIILWVFS